MDFEKMQVSITATSSLETLNMLNVEIGYKNSYGEIIWKSLGRVKDDDGFKKVNYNGKDQEVLEQATWKNFEDNKTYVFDFSVSDAKELFVRQTSSKKNDYSIETKEMMLNTNVTVHHADFFTLKIENIEI
jgi:hypothetical protein